MLFLGDVQMAGASPDAGEASLGLIVFREGHSHDW